MLGQQYFVSRKHTDEDCFYYPDNKGGDVIINGQCIPDAEVPVVTGFNANAVSTYSYNILKSLITPILFFG